MYSICWQCNLRHAPEYPYCKRILSNQCNCIYKDICIHSKLQNPVKESEVKPHRKPQRFSTLTELKCNHKFGAYQKILNCLECNTIFIALNNTTNIVVLNEDQISKL